MPALDNTMIHAVPYDCDLAMRWGDSHESWGGFPSLNSKKKPHFLCVFSGNLLGRYQYQTGRVYGFCVYFMMGVPEGSAESGSGEAGDRTCDPWFTRHSTYPLVPLHHGSFRQNSKDLFGIIYMKCPINLCLKIASFLEKL